MKKILFALCAAAVTLVACNKAEVASPIANDDARVVKFEAKNLYTFDTKSMDDNQTVGIWASDLSATNVQYTIGTDGSTRTLSTSSSPILWGVEQAGSTTTSDFFAVYPYASRTISSPGSGIIYSYDFSIDRTSGAAKDASVTDAEALMIAAQRAAPGVNETPDPVVFAFSHPFSQLVYRVTNNSDDAIEYATISGVYWDGVIKVTESSGSLVSAVDVTGKSKTTGDGSATKEEYLQSYDDNGVTVFHTITMPASGLTPSIIIKMYSGATYTYSISGTLDAVAGKKYTASITIGTTHNHTQTTTGREVTGTFTVTEWTDGTAPTIASGDGYVASSTLDYWPYLKGDFSNDGWGTNLPMKCVGNQVFEAEFTVTDATPKTGGYAQYKPVKKANSDGQLTWYGQSSYDSSNARSNIVSGSGENLGVNENGTYLITVDFINNWCKAVKQ